MRLPQAGCARRKSEGADEGPKVRGRAQPPQRSMHAQQTEYTELTAVECIRTSSLRAQTTRAGVQGAELC